jgi:hypothetical protein
MKVYFTASSSGSHKEDRENYLKVLQVIKSSKHTITNPYYAAMLESQEGGREDKGGVGEGDDVFETLRKKISNSDCVVAEITIPSTSLGIQIEYALSNKIPVLCLFKKGGNGDLPLMVRDYKNPLLFKQSYTPKNIAGILRRFFKNVPKTRIKFNMFIPYELDKYLSYLSKKDRIPKSEVVRNLLQDKLKADTEYSS